jgi:hypothetical protein
VREQHGSIAAQRLTEGVLFGRPSDEQPPPARGEHRRQPCPFFGSHTHIVALFGEPGRP